MSQLLLSTLGVVCPTCDEYNPPQATRCSACGGQVYVDAKPARAASGASPGQAPGASGVKGSPFAASGASGEKASVSGALKFGDLGGQATGASGLKAAPARSAAPLPPSIPPAAGASGLKAAAAPPGMKPSARPAGAGFPPAGASPLPAADVVKKPASKFGLLVLAGANKGQRFRLAASTCQLGRSRGQIMFPEDPFLSPLHATLQVRDGALVVRDEGSASGIYVSVPGQEAIAPNALFAAGHRLFRFTGALSAPPPPSGSPAVYGSPVPSGNVVYGVEEILVGGRAGRTVVTGNPIFTIGQSVCDLSFPKDAELATRHCELTPTPTGAVLRDLSGGLGTFVRISGERTLSFGDRIRLGEQILQVEA